MRKEREPNCNRKTEWFPHFLEEEILEGVRIQRRNKVREKTW